MALCARTGREAFVRSSARLRIKEPDGAFRRRTRRHSGLRCCPWHPARIVGEQQVDGDQLAHGYVAIIEARVFEGSEHSIGRHRKHREAAATSEVAERVGGEGLPEANSANDRDVGALVEEAPRHDLVDQRVIEDQRRGVRRQPLFSEQQRTGGFSSVPTSFATPGDTVLGERGFGSRSCPTVAAFLGVEVPRSPCSASVERRTGSSLISLRS